MRPERFPQISELQRTSLRESVGVTDGKLILAVGGVEPRKGSRELFQALGILKSRGHQIHLAILGGHSFQDYEDYRQEAIGLLPSLGLELGRDVITVGTVDEQALGQWFRAADVLAELARTNRIEVSLLTQAMLQLVFDFVPIDA